MKSKYKLTMCRLCLCENQCFLNIFDQNDWHGYIAAEVISNLVNYQVSKTDGYPHVVCSECLVKLTDFKVFKECCLKSRVTYDNMFVSSEILEEIKAEMDIGEGGSGLELCEQDPLTETSPDVIKFEEVIVDSSSYEVSEDPLKETEVSCGPILLKYEVLPFSRNSHIQEELTDSEIYGNSEKVESTAVLMQDSPQPVINQEELINDCSSGDETEELFKGFDSEEELTDSEVSGNPEKVESTSALMQDSPQKLQRNVIAPEKGVRRTRRRFECDHCKKVCTTKSGVRRHVKDHRFGKTYNPEEEEGERVFLPEIEIGGRKYGFECNCCKKVLATNSSLKQHLAIHGIGKGFKCDVCGRICVSISTLIRHIQQHTGERPFKCTECSKGFSHHGNLKVHMRIHTKVKPFKCKECDAIFNCSEHLKSHLRVHSDVKQYSCEVCHVSFRHKHILTSHMRTHSGDRPYKCTVCSKRFSQSSNLRRHQFVHSGEKPHPCPHCSKRFSLRENHKKHLKNVWSGDRPFKCTVCSKAFSHSSNLRKHQVVHSGEKPHPCPHCGKRFSLRENLKKHLKNVCVGNGGERD